MAVRGAGENDMLTARRGEEIGVTRREGGVEGSDLLGCHPADQVVQRLNCRWKEREESVSGWSTRHQFK